MVAIVLMTSNHNMACTLQLIHSIALNAKRSCAISALWAIVLMPNVPNRDKSVQWEKTNAQSAKHLLITCGNSMWKGPNSHFQNSLILEFWQDLDSIARDENQGKDKINRFYLCMMIKLGIPLTIALLWSVTKKIAKSPSWSRIETNIMRTVNPSWSTDARRRYVGWLSAVGVRAKNAKITIALALLDFNINQTRQMKKTTIYRVSHKRSS